MSDSCPDHLARLRAFGKASAAITFLFGLIGLAGWLFNEPLLRSFWRFGSEMKFNTAVALMLLGAALFVRLNRAEKFRMAANAAAFIVLLIGGITALEFLFSWDAGIDQLVYRDTHILGTTAPGRMAWQTALIFVGLALAVFLFDISVRRGFRPSNVLALLSLLVPSQAFIGYMLGRMSIAGLDPHSGYMALPTAVALIFAVFAVLLHEPGKCIMAIVTAPTQSSRIFRRLLFASLFLPPFLGWMALRASYGPNHTPEHSTATTAWYSMLLFVVLTWYNALRMTNAERALQQTAENLKRSNKELEQFAYICAHDLQEPLRTIASYVDLLMLKNKQELKGDSAAYLNYIQDGAHQAQELIQGVLQYASIGRQDDPFGGVDIETVLKNVLGNLKSVIEETGARITHDPLPVVNGNSLQLAQLLQNLISNAIKYRSQRTPEIHLSVRRQHEKWIFSCCDNGIGIESKYKERVFMIFKRLHGKDQYPGTGIGLAICKKIIDQHGGDIWLESDPGIGSTFYFSLPAHDTHAAISQ